MTNLKKLENYITKWLAGKKINDFNGLNVRYADMAECAGIYNSLYKGEQPTTENPVVLKILEKCGIKL